MFKTCGCLPTAFLKINTGKNKNKTVFKQKPVQERSIKTLFLQQKREGKEEKSFNREIS